MGYAVLALDDDVAGADDLQWGIASPAFVKRVRWGCALAKVARNLDGMDPIAFLHGARVLAAVSRWRFLLWTSADLPARRLQSNSRWPRGSVVSGARIGAHGHVAHGYRERPQGSVCRIQRS